MDVVFAVADACPALPDGGQVRIAKGTHWPATDPLVARYPHLFSTDPRYGMQYTVRPPGWDDPPATRPVEAATAAPGERRTTRRG